MDVICFSSQGWDNDLWTNKQHIMYRLAKRGIRVLYIDKEKGSLRKFVRQKNLWGVSEIDENLSIGQSFRIPIRKLSPGLRYYNEFGLKVDLIRRYAYACEDPLILWVYHPGYGPYLKRIRRKAFVLYDCVDDYASFPKYQSGKPKDWIVKAERSLLDISDLVIASSESLYQKKRRLHSNTHLIHNVGDFSHFSQVRNRTFSMPDQLKDMRSPRIGFYGAISSYKVDLELIRFVASQRPNWSICLMGPVGLGGGRTDVSGLDQLDNVTFTGKIGYQDLPSYISHMDVLMIPYRITEHTKSVFPIKFFECLATGKPLVITPLPALKEYYPDVEVGLSPTEFVERIEKVLQAESYERRRVRIELAKKNDWDMRIDRILEKISDTGEMLELNMTGPEG
jgi:glycosyltransferase involved in cell wall biosynthesis